MMRTLIVGAGALGCWLGATLFDKGEDVCLYHHSKEKAALLNKNGVTIIREGAEPMFARVPAYADPAEISGVELVLLVVKAHDTKSAALDISRLPGRQPDIISLQNGLGNMEILRQYFADDLLFGGVIYQGAQEQSPGKVAYAGPGKTSIAPLLPSRMADAALYAEWLLRCGIHAQVVDTATLSHERWQKLLVNAALNPVSALLRLSNGEVTYDQKALAMMAELTYEGVAVANSLGMDFAYEAAWDNLITACRNTAANKSSMRVDIEQGRKTEIDVINGAIVALADKKGIPTPKNEQIIAKIKALSKL